MGSGRVTLTDSLLLYSLRTTPPIAFDHDGYIICCRNKKTIVRFDHHTGMYGCITPFFLFCHHTMVNGQ
jgi:hypothetical protein